MSLVYLLYPELVDYISSFETIRECHKKALLPWIDESKLYKRFLSANPNANDYVKKHLHTIGNRGAFDSFDSFYLMRNINIWPVNGQFHANSIFLSNPDFWSQIEQKIISNEWIISDWKLICRNPRSFKMMSSERYFGNIVWSEFSNNPGVPLEFLETHIMKLDWWQLCKNPIAIPLLRQNHQNIVWSSVCRNRGALDLLREYPDNIHWNIISKTPGLVPLLEENPDKIVWTDLATNHSVEAIELLAKYVDKIDFYWLATNPFAGELLERYQDDKRFRDQVDWILLSANPGAINILQKHKKNIHWTAFSRNPAIFKIETDCYFQMLLNFSKA